MSVSRIQYPELFFGLVAPVGVNLDMIIEVLSTELDRQKYASSVIHVTNIMKDVESDVPIILEPYLENIQSRIDYADDVCEQLRRPDALAAITMTAIQTERENQNRQRAEREKVKIEPRAHLEGHAFVVRQFKRPAEILLMRQVYGKLFFQISAYSSPSKREDLLRADPGSS